MFYNFVELVISISTKNFAVESSHVFFRYRVINLWRWTKRYLQVNGFMRPYLTFRVIYIILQVLRKHFFTTQDIYNRIEMEITPWFSYSLLKYRFNGATTINLKLQPEIPHPALPVYLVSVTCIKIFGSVTDIFRNIR